MNHGLVVCAFLLVHLLLVFQLVPLRFLRTGELPAMGDVSRYFASAHSSVSAMGMAGYDPYVMAGYLAGGWNSMGKKGYEVAHWLLPGVPLPLLMSWLLVLFLLAAPILLAWAVFRLGGGRQGFVLPLGICLAYWHLETQTGTFLQCGNIGFPFAALLIPVAVALLTLLLEERRLWVASIGLGLVLVCVFYCHPVLMVPLGIAGLVLIGLHLGAMQRGAVWTGCGVAVAILALLGLPWIHVLIATRESYQPLLYEGFMGSFKHFVMDVFSDRAYRHHFDRNVFLQLAVVGGVAGAWLAARRRECPARILVACSCSGVICLALAYLSHLVPPLRPWQPYRFLVPAMFLLLPALCRALEEGVAVVKQSEAPARWLAVALGLLLLPRFTAHLIDLPASHVPVGIPVQQQQVLRVLAEKKIEGRVVCDDPQLGHLIPYYSGKAVLGGLSVMTFVKEGFAGVDEKGRLFNRFAGEWTVSEIRRYLDAYAAEYLVVARPDWVALFQQDPESFVPEGSIGPYRFFRVRPWSGYVMGGEAEVAYDSRGITVKGMKGSECVLKFHYSVALEAPDGVRLTRHSVLDDPVGFVRLQVQEGRRDCRVSFRSFTVDRGH